MTDRAKLVEDVLAAATRWYAAQRDRTPDGEARGELLCAVSALNASDSIAEKAEEPAPAAETGVTRREVLRVERDPHISDAEHRNVVASALESRSQCSPSNVLHLLQQVENLLAIADFTWGAPWAAEAVHPLRKVRDDIRFQTGADAIPAAELDPVTLTRMKQAHVARAPRATVGSAWSPIETAPKGEAKPYGNGPWLLLMTFTPPFVHANYTVGRFRWHGSAVRGAWADWDRNLKPTHWLPLPPPDAEVAPGKKENP